MNLRFPLALRGFVADTNILPIKLDFFVVVFVEFSEFSEHWLNNN